MVMVAATLEARARRTWVQSEEVAESSQVTDGAEAPNDHSTGGITGDATSAAGVTVTGGAAAFHLVGGHVAQGGGEVCSGTHWPHQQ